MSSLVALLRGVVQLVGPVVVGDLPASSVLLVGVIAAVAVITVAVAARIAALTLPGGVPPVLLSRADLPVWRSQSDPDGDGHTRSRAPGRAA
jgi:hypothetical protein